MRFTVLFVSEMPQQLLDELPLLVEIIQFTFSGITRSNFQFFSSALL